MDKEKLEFLADYISSISPELWEITLDYIHSAAIQWIVGFAGMFIIFVSSIVVAQKTKDYDAKNGALFFSVVFFLLSLFFLGAGIGRLNSPDLYAVRYLLQMVP